MTECRLLYLSPDGGLAPERLPTGATVETVTTVAAAVERIEAGGISLVVVCGVEATRHTRLLSRALDAGVVEPPPVVTDGASAVAAQERADRFADFAEVGCDRLWETDAANRIVSVLDQGGQPVLDDPVLTPGADLVAVLARSEIDTARQRTDRMEPFRDMVAHHSNDNGDAVVYRLSGKPVLDCSGNYLGLRGAASDVTDEVRDQREALRSRIRLYEAVENMPAAFMLFDADDRLLLWNTQAHAIYPYTRHRMFAGVTFEELLRAAADNGDIGDSVSGQSIDEWVEQRIAQHREPGMEVERLAPDGRWLRDTEHRTSFGGTVCVISDITELKTREAELRAAMEAAEQANQAKSKFLAAASHDLRQPLHAFGLLITGLSYRANTPEIERIANRMEQALESLQDMLNALLDISRLDAGVLRAEVGDVDMMRLFERIDADFQPIAQEKGLKLVVRPCDAVVRSDPMLLDRILRNLVSNAIRYTGEGGVLLGGRRRHDGLGHAVLRLECWDTGIGIREDKQREIFEEFHRLDEPVRDSRKGLGLGLAIVDRFSKLLGTPIALRSVYGKGSVFSIEVPLEDDSVTTAGQEDGHDAMATRPLQGLTVVLLDDDPLALESLTTLIEDWGGRVIAGESLDEVATLLADRDTVPDLMLVDYSLGDGVDGVAAIGALRDRHGQGVPALLVTGQTDPLSLDAVRATGLPWVTKPVPAAMMLAAIERILPVANDGGEAVTR